MLDNLILRSNLSRTVSRVGARCSEGFGLKALGSVAEHTGSHLTVAEVGSGAEAHCGGVAKVHLAGCENSEPPIVESLWATPTN